MSSEPTSGREKISTVVITCNDSRYLEKCLSSIAWTDEIVVCDMGSSDGTLEIAGRFTDKIFGIPKADFAGMVREEAVKHASNEWICCVDPDFDFPAGAAALVRGMIGLNAGLSCIPMVYKNHFKNKMIRFGRWGGDNGFPVFFRKSDMQLVPRLHSEFKLLRGETKALPRKYCIKHYWVGDDSAFFEKHRRYVANEGSRRLDAGHFPSVFRSAGIAADMVLRYLGGGFLDGFLGAKLLVYSLWYELASERSLRKVVREKAKARSCPLCGGQVRAEQNLFDDRYGYPGTFILHKCGKCRHRFLGNDFDEKELGRLYSQFYPRSKFDLEKFKPYERIGNSFKTWLNGEYSDAFRWVPSNVKVLDIGCGFGETLGYFLKQGCQAVGVEADQNIRRVAERFGYDVKVGLFDPDQFPKASFDYVVMHQVAEHLQDPVSTFRGIADVLKKGGTAVLSTPNSFGLLSRVFGRRWLNWHAPYHLQHYSNRSFAAVAGKAGLRIKAVKFITSSEWLNYQIGHAILFPAPGNPSDYWNWDQNPGSFGEKRFLIKIFRQFHKIKLTHLATRLFDFLRLGDNKIYFLEKI